MHVHPSGWRKKFCGPNLQGKVVIAHPRQRVHPKAKKEFIFRKLGAIWKLEEVYSGSFSVYIEGDD